MLQWWEKLKQSEPILDYHYELGMQNPALTTSNV